MYKTAVHAPPNVLHL